jgi:multidrug efflux pump subunit AcrA (membrane-fusion protein)
LIVVLALAAGAAWWFDVLHMFVSGKPVEAGALTEAVQRGPLTVAVTEDGTVESSSNLDVKCEVAGSATILWLVKDGSQVNEGDELVRLDSSLIEEQVNTQKIACEKAQATRIEAQRMFSAAKISVQEYAEGTFLQNLQTIDANVTVAMENLRSAENTYYYTERMARKGYVASLQRESQAFAVERAKLDLSAARTAKHVLETFTRPKMIEDLESKRDTAEAKMRAEEAAFELEESKLKRLTTQLEKCVIKAPRAGMVIYANENPGRGQTSVAIEEGATVRQSQSILRLPDLSHMQVKALVNESKVERLHPGMRARIRIQDAYYQGTVRFIANQAEPMGFLSTGSKDFATIVKIDDDEIPTDGSRQLKPGMTASVEILIAHLNDVLSIKLQAVKEVNEKMMVWVKTGSGAEPREVTLGPSDLTRVEVKSGLSENELVLLNPKPYVGDLKLGETTERKVDIKERYGDAPAEKSGLPGGAESRDKSNGSGIARGEGSGGKGGSQRNRDLIKEFDKDGDGKVSRDEAPEQVQQRFDRMDTNQDGFIDRQEQAAAAARRRQREAEGGGAPPSE